MSWLISKAMMDSLNLPCSLVREAESLAESCSDGEQSVQSSKTPMPQAFLSHDKTMAAWSRFPSGMTCVPFDQTTPTVAACLSSFAQCVTDSLSVADSLAKISPSLETASGSKAREVGYGKSLQESFAKYDHDSHSWRTHQHSLFGGLIEFSETWPRWGAMRTGESFRRKMPYGLKELRDFITDAKESGSSQQMLTPCSHDANPRTNANLFVTSSGSVRSRNADGTTSNCGLAVQVSSALVPTPTVCGLHNKKGASASSGDGLSTVVKAMKIPSPTASQCGDCESERSRRSPNLVAMVNMIGTPTASNRLRSALFAEGRIPTAREFAESVPTPTAHNSKEGDYPAEATRNTPTLAHVAGGSLNPDWTEWLMGWPIGWTDISQPCMSHFAAWTQEPDGVPRTAKGIKNRTGRLTAIGNGQVPLAAALAWRLLSK